MSGQPMGQPPETPQPFYLDEIRLPWWLFLGILIPFIPIGLGILTVMSALSK